MWKQTIKGLLAAIRWDRVLAARAARANLLVILNLHRVHPAPNPFWPAILPGHFEKLLSYLRQNFLVTSLEDLEYTHDRHPQKPYAVLSFDDGYLDFVQYAHPILDRYGVRANLNVIPDCVKNGTPPWNVELYDFLQSATPAVLRELSLPGFRDKLRSEAVTEKIRYGASLSRFLKQRPRTERVPLWEQLQSVMQRTNYQLTEMMRLDDVKRMSLHHDIGAHSYSHESMGFEEDSYFEEDVLHCQHYFQNALGMKCLYYAFPNGSYKENQINHLEKLEFKRALLVDEDYADARRFALTRFTIAADNLGDLKLQAAGFRSRRAYARTGSN
jgi:peptidoglycan/xylan/chitin deacetylase (PgdA/CDA1 family)